MNYLESWLRKSNTRPRLHPNGFIQVDMSNDGSTRFHVWPDPPIQAQQSHHPIHDHVFDMHSTVLLGKLINLNYWFMPNEVNSVYTLYRAKSLNERERNAKSQWVNESILIPTDQQGNVRIRSIEELHAGVSYSIPKGVLHESIAVGLTSTIMKKTSTYKEYRPFIAVPIGLQPDNEFRREAIEPEILWEQIHKATEEIIQCTQQSHIGLMSMSALQAQIEMR